MGPPARIYAQLLRQIAQSYSLEATLIPYSAFYHCHVSADCAESHRHLAGAPRAYRGVDPSSLSFHPITTKTSCLSLPPEMVFAPKGVVVTGATTHGIGRSLALALHDLPSKPKIIVTGRQQGKLEELASISDRIYGKRLDQLSSKEELQKWVQRLLNEHPDIDTVVLNAGVQIPADMSKPDTVDLDAVRLFAVCL